MIGKEFEHFLRTNDESVSFANLKGGIDYGLAWKRARVLDASPVVFEEINGEIGDHLLRLTDYLKLPSVPDVILTRDWADFAAPERQDQPDRIIAEAYFDKDIPTRGIIRLSPGFLKGIVDKKMGRRKDLPLPLELVLGHESFHLWQFKQEETARQLDKDLAELKARGFDGWNLTKSEVDAREFERFWLENWFKF